MQMYIHIAVGFQELRHFCLIQGIDRLVHKYPHQNNHITHLNNTASLYFMNDGCIEIQIEIHSFRCISIELRVTDGFFITISRKLHTIDLEPSLQGL